MKTIKLPVLFLLIAFCLSIQAQVAINKDGSAPAATSILHVKGDSIGTPVEAMFIESETGNVGIGTLNPTNKLSVAGDADIAGDLSITGNLDITGSISGISIDDLSDGKVQGNSVFLGPNAGNYDDGTDNQNTAIGLGALLFNTSGEYNVAIGYRALKEAETGVGNTAIGTEADRYNTSGSRNTIIGYHAGMGSSLHSKSGNIFIGHKAGLNETGDNKLYIENTNTVSPLIYGEFNNDLVRINGDLDIYSNADNNGLTLQTSDNTFSQGIRFRNSGESYTWNIYRKDAGTSHADLVFANGLSDDLSTFTDWVTFKDGGKVGIGTSSPSNKLSVAGNADITGNLDIAGDLDITGSISGISIDDLSDGKVQGYSVFLGPDAGLNDDGTNNLNTALGRDALYNNTSGANNVAIGYRALKNDSTGVKNTSIGTAADRYNTSGSRNTIIGYQAGMGSTLHSKSDNVFIGHAAGFNETGDNKLYIENTVSASPLIYGEFDNDLVRINGNLDITGSISGISIDDLSDGKVQGFSVFLGPDAGLNDDGTNNLNTALGREALYYNTSGANNVAIGYRALKRDSTGVRNTSIGTDADRHNTSGSRNTIIGYQAGMGSTLHSKSDNIFIGHMAGFNETGDNKLYIENTISASPLIYGEFDNDLVRINGNLGIGSSVFGSGTKTLSIKNGTAPTSSITDGILLFAKDDIVFSRSELMVRDEVGNVTTLSPHNFSIAPKSEPMAWSFYSENAATNQTINVDMLRAIRLIEEMAGEKLVYIRDKDNNPADKQINSGQIEQLQKTIEQQNQLINQLLIRIEKLEQK